MGAKWVRVKKDERRMQKGETCACMQKGERFTRMQKRETRVHKGQRHAYAQRYKVCAHKGERHACTRVKGARRRRVKSARVQRTSWRCWRALDRCKILLFRSFVLGRRLRVRIDYCKLVGVDIDNLAKNCPSAFLTC